MLYSAIISPPCINCTVLFQIWYSIKCGPYSLSNRLPKITYFYLFKQSFKSNVKTGILQFWFWKFLIVFNSFCVWKSFQLQRFSSLVHVFEANRSACSAELLSARSWGWSDLGLYCSYHHARFLFSPKISATHWRGANRRSGHPRENISSRIPSRGFPRPPPPQLSNPKHSADVLYEMVNLYVYFCFCQGENGANQMRMFRPLF